MNDIEFIFEIEDEAGQQQLRPGSHDDAGGSEGGRYDRPHCHNGGDAGPA